MQYKYYKNRILQQIGYKKNNIWFSEYNFYICGKFENRILVL